MLAISVIAFVGLAFLVDAFTGPDHEASDGDVIDDHGDGDLSDGNTSWRADLLDPSPTEEVDLDGPDGDTDRSPDEEVLADHNIRVYDADRTVSTRATSQPMLISDLAGSTDGDLSGTQNPDGTRTIDQIQFVDDDGAAHDTNTVLKSIAIRGLSENAADVFWNGEHVLTIQGFSADELVHQSVWIGNFSDMTP